MPTIFNYISRADSENVKQLLSKNENILVELMSNDREDRFMIPLVYAYKEIERLHGYDRRRDDSPVKIRAAKKLRSLEDEIYPLLYDASLKYAIDNNVDRIFAAIFKEMNEMEAYEAVFKAGELKGLTGLEYAQQVNPDVHKIFLKEIEANQRHAAFHEKFEQARQQADKREAELNKQRHDLIVNYVNQQSELISDTTNQIKEIDEKVHELLEQDQRDAARANREVKNAPEKSPAKSAFFSKSKNDNKNNNKKGKKDPDSCSKCVIL